MYIIYIIYFTIINNKNSNKSHNYILECYIKKKKMKNARPITAPLYRFYLFIIIIFFFLKLSNYCTFHRLSKYTKHKPLTHPTHSYQTVLSLPNARWRRTSGPISRGVHSVYFVLVSVLDVLPF